MRKRIFDMDGTLYAYTPDLVKKIQLSIGHAAIALGAPLTAEEAERISEESYIEHQHSSREFELRYGFTTAQVMTKSFEISDVTLVIPDQKLITDFRTAAASHKNSQVILTSSIEHWAGRMIPHLRLADIFKAVICLDHCNGEFKHESYYPFEKGLEAMNAEPKDTDMIEDSIPNLKTAKDMGMRTIFIHHGQPLSELPSFVDVQIFQPAQAYKLDNQP